MLPQASALVGLYSDTEFDWFTDAVPDTLSCRAELVRAKEEVPTTLRETLDSVLSSIDDMTNTEKTNYPNAVDRTTQHIFKDHLAAAEDPEMILSMFAGPGIGKSYFGNYLILGCTPEVWSKQKGLNPDQWKQAVPIPSLGQLREAVTQYPSLYRFSPKSPVEDLNNMLAELSSCWASCNSCQKWRRVTVKPTEKNWCCSDNPDEEHNAFLYSRSCQTQTSALMKVHHGSSPVQSR